MQGPAYPIIRRIRIPHGPHRLRDRRWPPPGQSPAPLPSTGAHEPGTIGTEPTTASAAAEPTASTSALPAGAPESALPPVVKALWEERQERLQPDQPVAAATNAAKSLSASDPLPDTISQHSEQSIPHSNPNR
jgi:hypothetical protein